MGNIALLLMPAACPQVQRAHIYPADLLEPGAQGLSKEGMVAVPAALAIQGHYKDIGPFQLFQHPLTARLLQRGITERGCELRKNRDAQQKRVHGWLLL